MPSVASLLFLLTGQDADKGDTPKEKKTREIKKRAIIEYIKTTISRFAEQENVLLKSESNASVNFNAEIDKC